MNADYVRLAHRKTIWSQLQAILLDKYIEQDGVAKEQLICEEVPYKNKDVTNEAFLEVLEILQQHEIDEQVEMRQFEFKRRRPKDDGQQQPPAPQPDPAAAAPAGEQGGAPSTGQAEEANGSGPDAGDGEPDAARSSGGDGEPDGKDGDGG